MGNLDVIGFGALNVDKIYRVDELIIDDEIAIKEVQEFPGGSAANTIYGLAKLGLNCGVLGIVGDDREGELLLADFQHVGVDSQQVKIKSEAKTGATFCLIDKAGKRAIYISPGANNYLTKADLDVKYINRAKLIHLSSFVNTKQLDLQKWLLANISSAIKVSFAPGAIYTRKGLDAVTTIIQRAQVVFINQKEVEQLTGEQYKIGAKELLSQGVQIVAVTLGEKGSYVTDGRQVYEIKGIGKEIKDTTGAGDAYAAGFLYGLLAGRDLKACGTLGNLMGWFCSRELGARGGLPNRDQLEEFYERLKAV